ncbi:EF-hand domain-containing protein [Allokutzneria albata]|uniref:Ca2+-binding protein, EF-hand superfamily n=1 Tax=Allokutzneria albata TaxID=211114 RepID=A0A1H0BXL4_ALLAB|nr:EF-hand domain-containing protein [Allokutzneria albata]SDN50316.1 Ca2+-binding protein, EF-hand superfamily [Allokutzneria albata]
MVADILVRKYTKIFKLYDSNRNGYIEKADVNRMKSQYLMAFDESPTSEKGRAVSERWDAFWAALTSSLDHDQDGQVSRDEFLNGFGALALGDSDTFDAVLRPLIETAFTLMDTDGSGSVSVAEFRRFQRAVGNGDQADAAIAQLDKDGDGMISLEELVQNAREFLTSPDLDSTGNWLLGDV